MADEFRYRGACLGTLGALLNRPDIAVYHRATLHRIDMRREYLGGSFSWTKAAEVSLSEWYSHGPWLRVDIADNVLPMAWPTNYVG